MGSIWKKWKLSVIGLIFILGIGFLIRVINLTVLPVFADEAIYVRWAQIMRAEETLRFLPLSDGKQPLYMWLVIPFLKLFSNPLFAGRFVSVLSGIGTGIGVFVSTYLLYKSKKVSLMASFLYLISPFSVFFDRLALSDSLLSFFGVWVFVGSLLLVNTLRFDIAMLTGFLLGGALLTKSPALYFSLLLPTAVILFSFKKEKKKIFKYLILLVPVYVIGYAMFNILRLGPNFYMLSQRNLDYVYPVSHLLTSFWDPLKPFIHRVYQYFLIIGLWPIVILFLLGVFALLKSKKSKLFLYTFAWFFVPIFLSSEFSKTMTARYVYFAVPFAFIIATAAFLNKSIQKNKWFRYFNIGLVVIFVLLSLSTNYLLLTNPASANLPRSERSGYLEEWTAGQGIYESYLFLKDRYDGSSKKVIVGTEGYFGTLPDGLQIYFEGDSQFTVIGVGLELDKIPEQLVNAKKAGDDVYLILNDERANTNYEDWGLELIKIYPKEERPDGTHQSLVMYEVPDSIEY